MDNFEFERVYLEYRDSVWRNVSRFVYSKHDREDLLQEIFLKVYKSFPKFRGDSDLGTWIYRISVNTSINFIKKSKRYKQLSEMLSKLRVFEDDNKEFFKDDAIFKPLEKLNPQQRIILVLSDIEEKKLDEIAEILNLPVGTVKSNLHRGREIVKKELVKYDKL